MNAIRLAATAAIAALALTGTPLADSPLKLKAQRSQPAAAAAQPAAPVVVPQVSAQPAPLFVEPAAPTPAPRMKVITLDNPAMARPLAAQVLTGADLPTAATVRLAVNKSRPLDLPADVAEIIVGSPEIADVVVRAPDQVYLMAKAVGDTNIFFLGRDGKLLRRIEINVHADVETLRLVLEQLLPDDRVEVNAFGDTITLVGTVRNDQVAQHARAIARRFVPGDANIINMLRIAGEQQVLLRVRLVEVRKSVLKELDVRFQYGPDAIAGTTSRFGSGSIPPGAANLLGIALTSQPISLDLHALEDEGLIRTLAEPTLTALSGEEARVLAGGEFPIAAVSEDNGVTVTYRNFGVSLAFVPVIVGPGRINLKLAAEVSAIERTIGAFEYPLLSVRRATTSVEIPSGGSMMIAGVLSNDIISQMDGFPGLKDIPVLGALFRSSSFRRQESEMVVTVEAYIVQPTEPQKLALPSDGFVPASDLDRYLLGRLHRVYDKPALPPTGEVVQGPIGYIVQ